MDIIGLLTMVAIFLVIIIVILLIIYFVIVLNNKKNRDKGQDNEIKVNSDNGEKLSNLITDRGSIFNFMEFDEIKDNMIIRKKGSQYIMVIQCQGVNYDLMSEDEKIGVEEGFVQFLNTLRFSIQLYVQTRSLNLREIVGEYRDRVKKIEDDIVTIDNKLKDAQAKENNTLVERLMYEKKRKENVLEYGADISEYVARLSTNKNVLQQKTYIIVSYYSLEFSGIGSYSKEEADNICFSELYTRCQSIIRSLSAAEVQGRVLDSEELAELLYVAYNRDESEIMQLSKALDAEYDALYSTGKDVLKKKQETLNEQINSESLELATDSIVSANKKLEEKVKAEIDKTKKIEKKALDLVDEYKDKMEPELYEETKKEVNKKTKWKIKKIES